MKTTIFAALPLLAAFSGAQALTLDFGGGPAAPTICSGTPDGLGSLTVCGDFAYLSQSYGDVAGVSDITYSAPRMTSPTSLEWWDTGYNTLYGVAFAPGGDGDSEALIEIAAVQPGASVTLSSFDLGAYSSVSRATTVNIYTIGGSTLLYTFTGNVGNGSVSPTPFALNVSALGGLWIEWQDSAYNVGIDNIQYTVSSVPEPGASLLVSMGLLSVLGAARLRRPR